MSDGIYLTESYLVTASIFDITEIAFFAIFWMVALSSKGQIMTEHTEVPIASSSSSQIFSKYIEDDILRALSVKRKKDEEAASFVDN